MFYRATPVVARALRLVHVHTKYKRVPFDRTAPQIELPRVSKTQLFQSIFLMRFDIPDLTCEEACLPLGHAIARIKSFGEFGRL